MMDVIDQGLTRLSFHDATLTRVSQIGQGVRLDIDDVSYLDHLGSAAVVIDGVTAILRDEAPLARFEMERDDGEILTLRQDDHWVTLVVQWNDFATKEGETVVYSFISGRLTATA